MKKCDFCEKEFEIFADHELINKGYKLLIPSQIDENNCGYDVSIEKLKTTKFKSIYLQYKIPEQYEGYCKKIYKEHCGDNPNRFFPHIDKKAKEYKQHNMLVETNNSLTKELALYCLPKFFTHTELHDYLNLGTIFKHSKLLKPIHKLDSKKNHIIVYGKKGAYQFSEEGKSIEVIDFESIEDNFNQMEYKCYNEWKNYWFEKLSIPNIQIYNEIESTYYNSHNYNDIKYDSFRNANLNIEDKMLFKLLAQNNVRFMVKFEN